MNRTATIAILGLPNAGKSTLLNSLIGDPIAAVSQAPQTTRTRILGVVNRENCQFAFLDTPGLHRPEHALNHRMMQRFEACLQEADLILWVVDATGFLGPNERDLAQRILAANLPTYLVINKIDLVRKGRLLEKIVAYKDLLSVKEIIPVGAKFGENLETLWSILMRDLPEGPWAYDQETFTDQSERDLAAEFIREKVLRKTRDAIPHGVAVEIERWVEADDSSLSDGVPCVETVIEARILVERSSHRKILIGSSGEKIRDIRQSAQREIRKLLQRPVRLELFVKVDEGWRDRPDRLDHLQL